jgi:hypothetical protein
MHTLDVRAAARAWRRHFRSGWRGLARPICTGECNGLCYGIIRRVTGEAGVLMFGRSSEVDWGKKNQDGIRRSGSRS